MVLSNLDLDMQKILVLCTHNSARSQMAEGWIKSLYADKYKAYSVGTNPAQVHPPAIQVMKEVGIDISYHQAKSLINF